MKIVPVPVRQDNYAYLLIDEASKKAAAVDPYDVNKVIAAAENVGVQLVAGITTHHHFDHSGGNKEFVSRFPGVPIYGGSDKIPALTNLVKDKDEFTLGDIHVKCLATPCHTQDSICYHVTDTVNEGHPGGVFTGDTLFIAGCGRFFEGVGSEMDTALSYLATLPSSTVVYNGHEYTQGNLAFAKTIEPENKALTRLDELLRSNEITTGLTTIGDEKEWNVFMRLGDATVKQAAGVSAEASSSAVMDALREMKNNFRG
ncbi:Metallo-hydrolase/oxidoreductase [Lentinula raphanica]|uniref:hydroxyacylglutathione hydrolase n=1 Tax=Lentinula raphanica TaxID=153919 RepID=A0AA38PCH5_9AGAR|nr:Metallo-hydrolase/oxidoreductase [Lentinula raphanica]KAJ3840133.1 Metallo-hydrolase/oxidoreductase [Lentinula raphanica]KAJ3968273.1 Metallo-hydrolase/oxidoreductase [Lentinula raphanica]